MDSLGSSSETAAMSDTYETYQGRLDEFRERLKYVEGATGLAVAVGQAGRRRGPVRQALDLSRRSGTGC